MSKTILSQSVFNNLPPVRKILIKMALTIDKKLAITELQGFDGYKGDSCYAQVALSLKKYFNDSDMDESRILIFSLPNANRTEAHAVLLDKDGETIVDIWKKDGGFYDTEKKRYVKPTRGDSALYYPQIANILVKNFKNNYISENE